MKKSRVRSSYQKSTRGCRTCKIRRVKCDETYPCCLKCTSTGRRCEGPTSRGLDFVADPINDRIDQARTPKTTVCATLWQSRPSEELRAFSYFIDRAAPVLTGPVDIGFWGTTIPQIAQTNQVIWYALIAIAGLWENPPLKPRNVRKDAERQRQALRWYAQAIANERSQSQNSHAGEKMLICVLCSCFEFQNLNYQSGLLTIRIAYNLLGRSMTAVRKPENELLFEALMTKFLRNACFSCTSRVFIDIHSRGHHHHHHHHRLNLDELEYSLFQLLLSTFGLLKEFYFLLLDQTELTKQTVHSSRAHIERQLTKWQTAADHQPESIRLSSLHTFHTVIKIWLTLLSTHPLTPRTFQTHILHASEDIVTHYSSSPTVPVYFHDFALLPPLYFLVMLSTDPLIYNRALTLMKFVTHQKRGEQIHSLVAIPRGDAGIVGMHMARIRWGGSGKQVEVEGCAFATTDL